MMLLAAMLLFVTLAPTASATLGVEPARIELGKVDPGHRSVHTTNVTNTGSETRTVAVQVPPDRPDYITVDPASFELAPGSTQAVTLTVDVAEDADPGLHDYTIKYVETTETGSGGTAVGAQGQLVNFAVRNAKVFIGGVTDQGNVFARFVNGFEEGWSVTVETTRTHDGQDVALDPHTFTIAGSETGTTNEQFQVPLGLDEDDPQGAYEVHMTATWENATTGESGSHTAGPFRFVHGAVVAVRDFRAVEEDGGIRFSGTLVNEGEEALDLQLEVQVTEEGRPDTITLLSDPVTVAAGGSTEASVLWEGATGTAYQAVAFAVYEGASSTERVRGPASDPIAVSGPGTDGTDGAGPTDGDAAGGYGLGTLVAIGVGAAALAGVVVWLVARRQ